MISNITFGQYFPADSVIHRMDPRVKLIIALAMIVVVFCIRDVWGYLIFAALLVGTIFASKINFKQVVKGIKPLWIIIIITFILNVLFYGGKTVIWQWWIITITKESILKAVEIAIRLVLLIEVTSLLTLTTSPMEITYALEILMAPLKKIKFPAHEIAMMMSIAIRFIPTLIEETDKIMKAQTARGADFDSGNILKRAAGLIPLLVPLLISAFERAEELSRAMEARCYNGGENRTRMKMLKLTKLDLYAVAIVVLLSIAMLLRI